MSDVVKLYALDKDDLIYLVMGNQPSYILLDHPTIKDHGVFRGNHDIWEWNKHSLQKLETHQLFMIHELCKQARKNLKGAN